MPHTKSRYQQELGFTDGIIIIPAQDCIATGGASVLTRNAAGNLSHNAGAAVSPIYSFCLGDGLVMRSGFSQDLQQQFGGAGVPGDAWPAGRPQDIGAMAALQHITPRVANLLKGIKILSVAVLYNITGAALTGHTCRLDRTVFANNVAPAITPIIAVGANGLALAAQANPYVTEVALAAAEQVYRISDLSQYWFEVAPTTQGGGAYRMYGLRVKVEFNFN